MLDYKFIVENAESVRENCANRGVEVDIDRFVDLQQQRKLKQAEVEDLNRRANQVSKSMRSWVRSWAAVPPGSTARRTFSQKRRRTGSSG